MSRNFHFAVSQQIGECWRLLDKYFAHFACSVAFAVFQNSHLCANFAHHRHLVGNGDDGDPEFFIEAHEQFKNFVGCSGVKG